MPSPTFILDMDDLGRDTSPTDFALLAHLKRRFPGLKLTCFTTPAYEIDVREPVSERQLKRILARPDSRAWIDRVKGMPWIEIAVHGLTHAQHEMAVGRSRAATILHNAEAALRLAGLPFVKIFRAPRYQISRDALLVLRDQGYVVASSPKSPVNVDGLPEYLFNWNYHEPLPSEAVVKGHGHLRGRLLNSITQVMPALRRLPRNAQFMTVSEYLATTGQTVLKDSEQPTSAETGDERPETRDRRPKTEDRRLETEDWRPKTGDHGSADHDP